MPNPTADTTEYLRDGDQIYARSFAIIREEADLRRFDKREAEVAVRMIHACGVVELARHIEFGAGLAESACTALRAGAPILCDAHMVVHGITARFLPAQNPVVCTLRSPEVPALAEQHHTTRSAAALELWRPQLAGSIVAIGNAPTALFRLLEMLGEGADPPAAILGAPVGFVGAQESKAALAAFASRRGIPFATVHGRMGGSAITAAAINALALECAA